MGKCRCRNVVENQFLKNLGEYLVHFNTIRLYLVIGNYHTVRV